MKKHQKMNNNLAQKCYSNLHAVTHWIQVEACKRFVPNPNNVAKIA